MQVLEEVRGQGRYEDQFHAGEEYQGEGGRRSDLDTPDVRYATGSTDPDGSLISGWLPLGERVIGDEECGNI
eukprot:1677122-Rhodomonas_salina.4